MILQGQMAGKCKNWDIKIITEIHFLQFSNFQSKCRKEKRGS